MLETIKSYLVSLGFAVDKSSYNEATKAMDSAESSVAKFAGGAVAKFAGAGLAVAAFAVTATIGIGKFVSSLGEAQIKNEMLARQMWTTQENAQAFSSTLKSMNATLQDLYLSPTLAQQFMELRKQAYSLQAPADYKNQMQLVQSVTFEFKRMKLEATYALQWIGYYLTKYLQGPIIEAKHALANANDKLSKDMPSWTKGIAQVLSWVVRMGITVGRVGSDIGRVIDDIGQKIPKNVKLIGGAIAALAIIIESGPVGLLIAGFTLLLLLLDDFYTYLDGGKSAFRPFWQKLIDGYNKFSDKIDGFKEKFKDVMKTAGDKVDWLKKKVDDFWNTLGDNGTLENFSQAFQNDLGIISDLFQGVWSWLQQTETALENSGAFNDLYNSFVDLVSAASEFEATVSDAIKKFLELDGTKETLKVIGTILTDIVVVAVEQLANTLKALADGISAVSKLFKGDFKGAASSAGDMLHDFFKGAKESSEKILGKQTSYIYPNSNTQNNTSNKVTLNQTNNIYGSDPRSTAGHAQANFEQMAYRNMRSVVV